MDETILHEDAVRDVIEEEIADAVDPQNEVTGVLTNAATNASTAHALNSTFSDTEAETALNALGTIINANAVKQNTNGTKLQAVIDALVAAGIFIDV